MARKTVAALIIGDEILAGHTQDTNTQWLAKRCLRLGLDLRRVEVCTDEVDDIAASVRRFLHELDVDYAITSGGLGPTPDDRTMEGIARALGVELHAEPAWVEWMHERVAEEHRRGYFDSPEPNAGILKMVQLPQGSEAMPNEVGTALGAIVRSGSTTLYTLPGVPVEFQRMFDGSVLPRLETSRPLYTEEVRLHTEESRFHDLLVELDLKYPRVALGSYPHWGSITIRATGPKEEVQRAIKDVREAGAAYLKP